MKLDPMRLSSENEKIESMSNLYISALLREKSKINSVCTNDIILPVTKTKKYIYTTYIYKPMFSEGA